jgi:iron complex transport system permease protein
LNSKIIFGLLTIALAVLFVAGLAFGSVSIPLSTITDYIFGRNIADSYNVILTQIRLPRNITAILSGAGLSLSGLLLQTLFRNPLAGPSILGISSGSGLGVAMVLLTGVSMTGIAGTGSIVFGAVIGALIVVVLISIISLKFEDVTLVLIAGMMLGFLSSALISILAFFSNSEQLKPFIHWGFGSFSRLNEYQIPTLFITLILAVVATVFLYKPLNAFLPGDQFAGSVGINVRKSRIIIIVLTGLLTGIITAFVGPIGFIGLAVPQLVKMIFNTNHHRITIPGTLLFGAFIALACDIISRVPGQDYSLPLNAITALFGAPVVLFILFRSRFVKKVLS